MLRLIPKRLQRLPAVNPLWLVLGAGFWLAGLPNTALWQALTSPPIRQAGGWAVAAVLFVVIVATCVVLVAPLAYSRWVRPVLALLLVLASLMCHFMTAYGVVIDPLMVDNALQTDWRESMDLVGWRMLWVVGVLGVLPAWLLWKIPLRKVGLARQTLANALAAIVALVVMAAVVLLGFQPFSSLMRNETALRYLINPYNGLWGAARQVVRSAQARDLPLLAVGRDAHLAQHPASAKHSGVPLIVLVVGETARSDHFGVNGYARDTTPQLARLSADAGWASYRNVESCGTNTAISLPCMFSHRGQAGQGDVRGPEENLLDVLMHAGLAVAWIDNQSGCKGVCDRLPSTFTRDASAPDLCGPDTDGCPDEIMLREWPSRLQALDPGRRSNGVVLVMHQMGGHGPAYHQRSPNTHKRFLPECKSPHLSQCDRSALLNAYDNSIAYTDHFLGSLQKELAASTQWSSVAILYVADHGESLGEHGIFLHGLPRAVAPREQLHVPWIHWLSAQFLQDNQLDAGCLRARASVALSHDHYFHTVLGLAGVQTHLYRSDLDAYAPCRSATPGALLARAGAAPAPTP